MARTGVSASAVHRACFAIAEQGKSVTVEAVRSITGGSNSTLAPAVRSWKALYPEGVAASDTGLPADLLHAATAIYTRAQAAAEGRVQAAEEDLAVTKREAQNSLDLAAELSMQLENDNAKLCSKIATLQSEIATQRATINSLTTQLAVKTERLAGAVADLERTSVEAKRREHQHVYLEEKIIEQMREGQRASRQTRDELMSEHREIIKTAADLAACLRAAQAHSAELHALVERISRDNVVIRTELAHANVRCLQLSSELSQVHSNQNG